MPLAIPGRTKDAVVEVAADSDWRSGVEAFLRKVGADGDQAAYHLSVLEQRAAGRMSWKSQFADRTLPSGRPMPAGRAYVQMLVEEGTLPLYDAGGWLFSVDLHNPDNEAGVACLSGAAFGHLGEGYMRFSYANSTENIVEGLRRVRTYLESR